MILLVGLTTISEKIRFIESVFGTGRLARNEKNFDVWCPVCAPGDHNKKKLSIHIEDDRCHCWSCGYKAHTLAPLLRKHASREKLFEYVERFMPVSERSRRCIFVNIAEEKPSLALPSDFKLLATTTSRDPDVIAIRRYLLEPLPMGRGLSERDLWYFKLGYSNDPRWRRRVIMPSFNSAGELNYFVGRAIDRFRKPKYDSPDEDKLPVIFNEINVDWTRELVLCEGPFDLVKCPDNSVPLLGSDINEQSALFNMIIAHSTPIVLALDGDMRYKKVPKVAKKLMEYDVVVKILQLREDIDPGQLTKEHVKGLVATAPEFTWAESFRDKIEFATRMALYR